MGNPAILPITKYNFRDIARILCNYVKNNNNNLIEHQVPDSSYWLVPDSGTNNLAAIKNGARNEIRYNPQFVLNALNPELVYFSLQHEIAHLHHNHPGNNHPDSIQNEIQADTTALITVIEENVPFDYQTPIQQFINLLEHYINNNIHVGESHPDNTYRKNRLIEINELIKTNAKININFSAEFHSQDKQDHEAALEAVGLTAEDKQEHCIVPCYVSKFDSSGETTYENYLVWKEKLEAISRKIEVKDYKFDFKWTTSPKDVYISEYKSKDEEFVSSPRPMQLE
ncbi:DUF2201 family putative metallopeptidase [Paenibacillus tyrfis]|uniref:DUF2201 family putative metallopeptidase n=1 Tax=Paenibacillus tyrfis TaxID=1501230 RepID=UPI00209F8208|nr:hypothetical protein [Paenibacillus tyrfis]MCP1311915.1 hypothetical protein [Paenibacillus tyrfis]